MSENKTDAQKFGYEMLKIIDRNVNVKFFVSRTAEVFDFLFFYWTLELMPIA